MAGLGELLAHLPALGDREVAVVHDLEPAVTLDLVMERQFRVVVRRVDLADRRVEDLLPVGGVVALVRRLARLERAQPVAQGDLLAIHGLVDHGVLDDLPRGGVRHQQPAPVRRHGHVVGAVPVDRLLARDAGDAPGAGRLGDVDPHHVAQARTGHREVLAVRGREHVVDELVVALAGKVPDQEEEREARRVQADVAQLLRLVGDQVDARLEHLEGVLVDDRGSARPVVPHPHDVAEVHRHLGGRFGRCGADSRGAGAGEADGERKAAEDCNSRTHDGGSFRESSDSRPNCGAAVMLAT